MPKKKTPSRKVTQVFSPAYTIIEMVVVIFIIFTITALGVANFRGFNRRAEFSRVLNNIVLDMRLAQEQALSGIKPAGCNVLDGYVFQRQAASGYRIFASCDGGGSYVFKTVSVSPVVIQFINPYQPPWSQHLEFNVLGRGVKTNSNNMVKLRVRNTTLEFDTNIVVTKQGVIYIE